MDRHPPSKNTFYTKNSSRYAKPQSTTQPCLITPSSFLIYIGWL